MICLWWKSEPQSQTQNNLPVVFFLWSEQKDDSSSISIMANSIFDVFFQTFRIHVICSVCLFSDVVPQLCESVHDSLSQMFEVPARQPAPHLAGPAHTRHISRTLSAMIAHITRTSSDSDGVYVDISDTNITEQSHTSCFSCRVVSNTGKPSLKDSCKSWKFRMTSP